MSLDVIGLGVSTLDILSLVDAFPSGDDVQRATAIAAQGAPTKKQTQELAKLERAAQKAGDKFGGCSVHVVTPGVDEGPVLAQTPVAILPGDTVETLARRVQFAEHQLYPATLAAFVTRERSPDYLRDRVRELAMALPEADEVTSHGMPCFGIVKGKKFAYFTEDHHGDGKIALLVKISGGEEQAMLIELDEERYYRPAYFGDGWVGIRLDLGDTDWDAIGEWLRKSWLAIAPKKLAGLMGVADEF